MGYLTAACVVAHPDDCVIFARPFIDAHPELAWTIVYLTYNPTEPRAQEISAYWNSRDINTVFLGFKDDYRDQESQQLNFWYGLDAIVEIQTAVKEFDLVLTHNANGEYNHIHHRLVNDAVTLTELPMVTFAFSNESAYNAEHTASSVLDLNELPLHRDVIAGFVNRDTGRYFVSDPAQELLKKVL